MRSFVKKMYGIKNSEVINFRELSLPMLIDYLSNTHHGYMQGVIGALDSLITAAANLDQNKYPEIHLINEITNKLKDLLNKHLEMEEQILFPYADALKRQHQCLYKMERTSDLVLKIKKEHASVSDHLHQLRTLSHDYSASKDAPPALKLYYAQMFELEQDVLRHVFIEENFLLPKLQEYEKRMRIDK